MAREDTPVLIAYDGSELSRGTVRHAAELFPGRPAVLATVWEPGLAAVVAGPSESFGAGTLPPDAATLEALDRIQPRVTCQEGTGHEYVLDNEFLWLIRAP